MSLAKISLAQWSVSVLMAILVELARDLMHLYNLFSYSTVINQIFFKLHFLEDIH